MKRANDQSKRTNKGNETNEGNNEQTNDKTTKQKIKRTNRWSKERTSVQSKERMNFWLSNVRSGKPLKKRPHSGVLFSFFQLFSSIFWWKIVNVLTLPEHDFLGVLGICNSISDRSWCNVDVVFFPFLVFFYISHTLNIGGSNCQKIALSDSLDISP